MGLNRTELGLPQETTGKREDIPWSQNPRPQEIRRDLRDAPTWQTLNGTWDLAMTTDPNEMTSNPKQVEFTHTILVPFPIEAPLSGIGKVEDIPEAWYHRDFWLPDEWLREGKRILLHIDSADYESHVYMNEQAEPVISHRGGYTPFSGEITDLVKDGEHHDMYVQVRDDLQDDLQPRGKQSRTLDEWGCYYTPKTGISGPVWLRAVPSTFIQQRQYFPDLAGRSIGMRLGINGDYEGLKVNTKIYADGKEVGTNDTAADDTVGVSVPVSEVIPWEPRTQEKPFLYDVEHTLYQTGGKEVDRVESKFGMREFIIDGKQFVLNGDPLFLRFVLYQGYHPGSLYLPPDISVTEEHVRLIKEMGFNGLRYHQNVPHPQEVDIFDREGILWSLEHPNWSADHSDSRYIDTIWNEYRESIDTHFNSPSWVIAAPLNETPDDQHPSLIPTIYRNTKEAVGDTRLVADVSGFNRSDLNNTDFLTIHDYTTDPEALAENVRKQNIRTDMPVVFNEYGGVRTDPSDGNWDSWYGRTKSTLSPEADPEEECIAEEPIKHLEEGVVWGYGQDPRTEKEAIDRIAALTQALKEAGAAGYCYTQFNDTGREHNGLTTPEGKLKVPIEKLKTIFTEEPEVKADEKAAD